MSYRYGDRDQITFLPHRVEEYVGNDDPVRVYDAFIDALGSEKIGLKLNSNLVGNSSYNPLTMLKVLVYGYSYGWRSSRKLERALHHNLSFIWLSGGLKPDFKTISRFRKDNKEILKNLMKQCARMCISLGLIEGNTLFVDGSKFRANAGNSQSKSKEAWSKYRKDIEKRIEYLLEECQNIDNQESESLVKVNKELRSKEQLKSKIDNLLEELNEEKKINGTDPDCKIMHGRQGSHAGYNVQITTDEAYGLLVSTDATRSMNDLNEMTSQIKNAEEILEKESNNICADAGYSSIDDLMPLMGKDKTIIIPNNKQAQKKMTKDPFGKHAFIYDEQKDSYSCPEGNLLYRSHQAKGSNKIVYRMKNEHSCKACKNYGACTSAKRGRTINRLVNEQAKESLANTYESEKGQEIYNKRKMKVELPFGHIKRNLGAGAFLLRGLNGVNAEINLLGTCFNIARMITIMGGVPQLITKMKNLA